MKRTITEKELNDIVRNVIKESMDEGLWDFGKSFARSIGGDAKKGMEKAANNAVGKTRQAAGAVKGAYNRAADAVKGGAQSVGNAVNNAGRAVGNYMQNQAQAAQSDSEAADLQKLQNYVNNFLQKYQVSKYTQRQMKAFLNALKSESKQLTQNAMAIRKGLGNGALNVNESIDRIVRDEIMKLKD